MSNPNPKTEQIKPYQNMYKNMTPEERAEWHRKGVEARIKKQRELKKSREIAFKWLRSEAPEQLRAIIEKSGFKLGDCDCVEDLLDIAHILKAAQGNDKAYRLILEKSGVLQTQGTVAGITPEKIDFVKQTLEEIKNKEDGTGTAGNQDQSGTVK